MFSLLRLPGSGLLVRLATLRFNVLRNFGRLIDIPSDKDSSPGLIVCPVDSRGCEVGSPCGFDSRFANDE